MNKLYFLISSQQVPIDLMYKNGIKLPACDLCKENSNKIYMLREYESEKIDVTLTVCDECLKKNNLKVVGLNTKLPEKKFIAPVIKRPCEDCPQNQEVKIDREAYEKNKDKFEKK
jgi:hypothetical protein